jgi:hypothetical protein
MFIFKLEDFEWFGPSNIDNRSLGGIYELLKELWLPKKDSFPWN